MPLLKPILAWLVILGLAIANGTLREALLIPALGESGGLILSGLLLCLLVALVAYGLVRRGCAIVRMARSVRSVTRGASRLMAS